jgi:DNA helicase-2/ATP-dependent DNA helicase PcrA
MVDNGLEGLRMDIKKKLIEEESKVLDNKIKVMKSQIRKNDEVIKAYSLQDINTYKKVDESEYLKILKEQNNLDSSLDNPYFGRLDIEFKDDNEKETIYIGRRRVDINDDTIIYSWAAPIATIYEEYNSGEYRHKHTDDKTGKEIILEGNILEKRKISIEKSKVKDVYSYNTITEKDEEEFVREKIENAKTDKLGVIVETIQKDQNKIIRLPIEKNIIVQGCAGSGKSSVAFHRLAYLTYNYKLKDNELLVISPNKIFQGYTSNILMELGSDFNVQQFTFKEFAEFVIQRKINTSSSYSTQRSNEDAKIKTGKRFKEILDRYIKYIDESFIPKEDIVIDDFILISCEEINSIWHKQFGTYKINDRIERFKEYIWKKLKEKTEEYIKKVERRYKSNIEVLNKYNKSPVIYNEILKLSRDEQEIRVKRLKKQCSAIINGYISSLNKINAITLYEDLLKNRELINALGENSITENEIESIISEGKDNLINDIDCIPILYLYYKVNENKNKYRHIVIDECQDLSYLEISVIEGLTKSFTLVGDFNQRISTNKSTVSLDEISEMFKKYTFFDMYCLNKSFRNSMSITNYSNAILGEYFISKESIPVSFNRETAKPKVYLKMGKKQTIKAIVDNINSKSSDDKNIAIILKTEAAANQYYNELSKLLKDKNINLIDNEYCKYEKGINILSAQLSKGLEFDYVIIGDANEFGNNENDRRLLYIATTRALHELEIYTESTDCFITTIENELWDSKFKLSTNAMNQGLQKIIIKTLSEGFGDLPPEYIDYIESIDDFMELSSFAIKLEGIEDVDKLFEEEGVIRKVEIEEVKEINQSLSEITIEKRHETGNLEKLMNDIKSRNKYFTEKQSEVLEYILENIEELPKYKTCRQFADSVGVSSATINTTLLKLNLGSFGNFISKIRECIKKDSKK